METERPKARVLAFYLPQYHPIPENDRWWKPGFTEWMNVRKAKPLFPGHYQPRVPAGPYYDLRDPEVRLAQARMAQDHGIEGFCYWHYWFGGGKRLLERPFAEVLASGEPDFPFCLAWANESWTGIWHGAPDRMLMPQVYPGEEDLLRHFRAMETAFFDKRCVRVCGRPLFVVYHPEMLPEPERFVDTWQDLALRSGLPGLHLVGMAAPGGCWDPLSHGFDAVMGHPPHDLLLRNPRVRLRRRWKKFLRHLSGLPADEGFSGPEVHAYRDIVRLSIAKPVHPREYPCVVPDWDNSPRTGTSSLILNGSTPEDFKACLQDAVEKLSSRDRERRVLFIKSWNEWGESNYLEPDEKFADAYLRAVRESLLGGREPEGLSGSVPTL